MENNTTQLKKFTPETMKEIVYVTWPDTCTSRGQSCMG